MKRGYTLIELATVMGIMGTLTLVDSQDEQFKAQQLKAQALGGEIFQYNAAVGRYLASNSANPSGVTGTYTGADWLKSSDCSGPDTKEYLSCHYLPDNKTRAHGSEPTTTISVTGDGGLEARTVWTPAIGGAGGIDSTTMGIAAMIASGSYIAKLDSPGGAYHGPTVFCPDIASYAASIDAVCQSDKNRIVSMAATSSKVEEWLRVDHGNTMKSYLEFDDGTGNPSAGADLDSVDSNSVRQIVNVARIYNIGNLSGGRDSVAIGSYHGNNIYSDSFILGNALLDNAVILDGNVGVMEDIYVRANAHMQNAFAKGYIEAGDFGGVAGDYETGNILAANDLYAGDDLIIQDDVTAGGGMDVGQSVSIGNDLWVADDIDLGDDVTAGDDITAGQNMVAGLDVTAGQHVIAGQNITAGNDITASRDIIAMDDVMAGDDVKATNNVEAGQHMYAENYHGYHVYANALIDNGASRGTGADYENGGWELNPSHHSRIRNVDVEGILNANARLNVNEFLSINSEAIIGRSCDVHGLVSRNADGLLLSCQSGVWRSQIPNNLTVYSEWVEDSAKRVPLGRHSLCVLSGIKGPGGFDTICEVDRTDTGIWRLHLKDVNNDARDVGHTHQCIATCLD